MTETPAATNDWRSQTIRRIEEVSLWLLVIGASAYIVVYLVIAAVRLSYPYELEWLEGGAVMHVDRLLRGQPLYAQPSLEFVASVYTPLYFHVSAAFAYVLGIGFVPLRVVSLLSSIGCLIFIFLIVRRRTGAVLPAVLSSCLFAASFRAMGAWLDIARVDSLFMCLLLGGIYAFNSSRLVHRTVLSSVLLFLAFFTKQSALVVAAGLMAAALLRRHGSERLVLPVLFALLVAGSTGVMNAATGGWYGYYVFDLRPIHDRPDFMLRFWTHDLILNFPVAIVLAFAVVFNEGRRWWTTQGIEDAAILGGLVVASYLSRLHSGAYTNNLMPAVAGLSIFLGIGFAQLRSHWKDATFGHIPLYVFTALQFLLLVYSPQYQIPSGADRRAGDALLERLSTLNGDIYLAEHPWYLRMIGKPAQAQAMAITDVIRGDPQAGGDFLHADMSSAIVRGHYDAFVTDAEQFALRPPDFTARYELVDSALTGRNFVPVTGARRKPTYLFVRRSQPLN